NPVTATSAEIAGIPTEQGNFSVVIQATDSDGSTDEVTINIEISTDVIVAPDLGSTIIEIDSETNPITDMNDYNTGGPVDNWALSELKEGVSLDPVSGILTLVECAQFSGEVTATNSAGSSMVEIEAFSCS
ncbi:MAG: hypothetical protein GY697_00645, partial [Desulfobacterales bacterium]|nr:hypothetical protein [Desulfobacterales bacterium]